jgi:hypothetical protein
MEEVVDMGRGRNGFGALSELTGVKRTVESIWPYRELLSKVLLDILS